MKTRVNLTGTLIVARDSAHAKLEERLDRGEGLPDYFKQFPVYYAGPAKTPQGMPSGLVRPTTAGRMDSTSTCSRPMAGRWSCWPKATAARQVVDACKKHKGFYLGSIGGPAAILAKNCIKKVEGSEYPELGMEAIWRIQVENFWPSSSPMTRATTSSASSRSDGLHLGPARRAAPLIRCKK